MTSRMIQGLILIGLMSYIQAVTVECDAFEGNMTFDQSDFDKLGLMTNDEWYIDSDEQSSTSSLDDDCTGTTIAELPGILNYSQCNPVLSVVNKKLCYTWTLRKSPATSTIYERANACIDIKCEIELNYGNLTTAIMPDLIKYTTTAISTFDFMLELKTYSTSARDLGSATDFEVPATVYGLIEITDPDPATGYSIDIIDCYVKDTTDNTNIYDIVDDEMLVVADDTNDFRDGQDEGKAHFSFDSFVWIDGVDYQIVCDVCVCDTMITAGDPGACTPYPAIGRRRRRNTREIDESRLRRVVSPRLTFHK